MFRGNNLLVMGLSSFCKGPAPRQYSKLILNLVESVGISNGITCFSW
jgi:hypothetical protein